MSLAKQSSSALKSRRTQSVARSGGPRGIQPGWTVGEPSTDNSRHGIREKNWHFLTKRTAKKALAASQSYIKNNETGDLLAIDDKTGQLEMLA